MCDSTLPPAVLPGQKTALLPASRFSKHILAPNMIEVASMRYFLDTTCCIQDGLPVAATAMCHECHEVMCHACTRHALTPEDRDAFSKEVLQAKHPSLYKLILEKVACYACAWGKDGTTFPDRVTTESGLFLPYIRVLRCGDKKAKVPDSDPHPVLTRKPEFRTLPAELIAAMQAFSVGAADTKVRWRQSQQPKQARQVHFPCSLQTPEEETEEPPPSPPPPPPVQPPE